MTLTLTRYPDDILSTSDYVWCTDNPEDPEHDTYDAFDYGPEFIVKAGEEVRLPNVWGFFRDGRGMTNTVHIGLHVERAMSLKYAVAEVFNRYRLGMNLIDADPRFLFVENIERHRDGHFEIVWGS